MNPTQWMRTTVVFAGVPAVALVVVASALALGGCASYKNQATGTVVLGPGGHAEGTFPVQGGEYLLKLTVRGSGRVDYKVADASGTVLQHGPLATSEARLDGSRRSVITVTLDMKVGDSAAVDYVLDGEDPDVTWDLSKTNGPGALQ